MSLDLVRTLRAAGLAVRDERVSPRPGDFAPVGVLNHHTAGGSSGDAPSLAVLKRGRSDVPGPLCHVLVGRSGTCYVVANGRANHAGRGSSKVLRETRTNVAPSGTAASRNLVDDADGNTWYVGIEIENTGTGHEAYSAAQLRAVVVANAAILRALDAPRAERVVGHLEWTRRKVDPRGFSMKSLRADVERQLSGTEEDEDVALTAEDKKWIVSLVARLNQSVGWGYNPDDGLIPDSDSWQEATAANNVRQVIRVTTEQAQQVNAAIKAAKDEILAATRAGVDPAVLERIVRGIFADAGTK